MSRRQVFHLSGIRAQRGGIAPVIARTYGTYLLVLSMVLASVGAVRFGAGNYQAVVDRYGLTASGWSWIDAESYGQLLSYSFLHSGSVHFLGNTLLLLLAGNVIERRIGFRWMSAVFVAGALASGLVHILGFPGEARPLIGASGAVSALLGAAWVLAGDFGFSLRVPFARRWCALTLRRVLLVWLFLQLWGLVPTMVLGADTPTVAYWGHLAGFLTGLVVAALYLFTNAAHREAELPADLAPGYSGAGD